MIKLEQLRGKVTIKVPRPSVWPYDFGEYWPPPHALLIARVINKGITKEDQDASDWIDFATYPDALPPSKVKIFAQLEEYIRLLIPQDITDDVLKHAMLAVSLNAAKLEYGTQGTMIVGVHSIEYSLLGHLCKPNCEGEREFEDDPRSIAVYTIEDINAGERVAISFVLNTHYMNISDIRRQNLKECFGIDCKCYVCQGESVPGSDLWLISRKKCSLVTPWSFNMAGKAMVRGWNTLADCILKLPAESTPILKSSLENLHIYLDHRNIMLVLTAMTLFLKYCDIGASKEAIDVYYKSINLSGLTALMDYGTRNDVIDITGNLCFCLLDIRRVFEFHVMFKLTQLIHPKRPSCRELCDILHLNPPPQLSTEDFKEENLEARADRLGIPRDFFVQHIRELRERMPGGRPDLPTVLEECQSLLGIDF